MPSVREQYLQAVKAKLVAIGGYTVERNPDDEPADNQLPALLLLDGETQGPSSVTGLDQYSDFLEVATYVKDAGSGLEAALDAAFVAVMDSLLADKTLGGLVVDVALSGADVPDYVRAEGGRPYAARSLTFEVKWWAKEGDVSTAGP